MFFGKSPFRAYFLLLIGLIGLFPSFVFGQIHGQVLSIGFNNYYRPDCWTPMQVQLVSADEDPTDYQIQVLQEDRDRDKVSYTQQITVGGSTGGKGSMAENYWVYFKPKPTEGGLPDASDITTSLQTLGRDLKVFVCDKNGKQLATLPLTATIISVDPNREQIGDQSRSKKLVLLVTDSTDRPSFPDYSKLRGVMEDVIPVPIKPTDLPSDVRGLEGVDAIVWMNADANELVSGTYTPVLEALRQWVHQGGHLVVCQPAESIKIKPFADMLPVGGLLQGEWAIPVVDRSDIPIFRRLEPGWPTEMGPFKVARVPALADAKVEEWMKWDDGAATSYSPWLARRPVGLGAVTWVAQNLGNQALTNVAKDGWQKIWDRVIGWHNPEEIPNPDNYKPADQAVDLGQPMWQGIKLTRTVVLYVAIAWLCYIVYFAAAGPGIYFALLAMKRVKWSWFGFAATALAATVVAALVVQVAKQGGPQLRHTSLVRYALDDPIGYVDSRFSLYIKRDGAQEIALTDEAPNQVSEITPFSPHPQYVANEDVLPAYLEYEIPVQSGGDSDTTTVTIPYRSTSKQLCAHWVGQMKGSIHVATGMAIPQIQPSGSGQYLQGELVNQTGFDLRDIYLAFSRPEAPASEDEPYAQETDWVIYVPIWPKDVLLKLEDLTVRADFVTKEPSQWSLPEKSPAFQSVAGLWQSFWQTHRENLDAAEFALPVLTIFDHIPPFRAEQASNLERFELYRRGARMLDRSASMSAGRLVICATAMVDGDVNKTPLAVPLTVNGSPVTGDGMTFVQYVLPLDRSLVNAPPATRPTTPATQVSQ